jgi:hypothetical protein
MVPNTTRALVALLLIAAGCGASEAEIRRAKTSGFETDFAIVYSETLAAVRDLYPNVVEDARAGVIKTAWHVVRVQQGNQADPANQQQRSGLGGTPATGTLQTTNAYREQFFIRFTVYVTGGKPWRVRVNGQASEWKVGEIPTAMKGAEVPHWLAGREDALRLAIFKRLEKYAVPLKYKSSEDKVVAPPADASKYKGVPEPADPTMLAELASAIEAGCATSADGKQVTCPAAAAATADGYAGYRAGFAELGGTWKMVSFVAGE